MWKFESYHESIDFFSKGNQEPFKDLSRKVKDSGC